MKSACLQEPRHPERGAIAIVVAAMLTTLFGFAALAVDAGWWYTRTRMLQGVADAAVAAGMRSMPGTPATAINQARQIASANGYAGATITTPAANQLRVSISATQTSFFGAIFGIPTKTLTATAIGQTVPVPAAIVALGNCGSATGLSVNGNSAYTINGAVQSRGPLLFQNGPAITTVTGPVESPCAGMPFANDSGLVWNRFQGGFGTALQPITDPFAGTPFPPCTFNVVGDMNLSPGTPGLMDGLGNLTAGVYCATGSITVGAPNINGNVTFVAGQNIIIGANGPSNLNAFAGNIVAWAQRAGGCNTGPTINLGNNSLVVNGSIYAPNGCINAGGTNFVVNGSLVGLEVFMGAWGPWTINPGGGGGGGNWRMLQ